MANGILKDEATYYGDSEKYTGDSGSSSNMYVIEDTYDLIKALQPTQTGAVDYYMRLVNDIDFNDHSTYKKGFTGAVYKDAQYRLYGDGHKIRNIVAMNATTNIFRFQYIENVDFVNLVSINCSSLFIIKTVGTANKCNFGIFFSNGRFRLDSGTYNDCTFNMKGKVSQKDFIRVQTTSFKRCHFNFDISSQMRVGNASGTEAGFIYGSDNSNTYANSFTNCYFTGKLKDSGAYSPIFAPKYTTLSNCYFAFEYNGTKNFSSSGSATFSTCFIDKELFAKNGNTALPSALTQLTTAQAQDADYLNSIGFAVVPIE